MDNYNIGDRVEIQKRRFLFTKGLNTFKGTVVGVENWPEQNSWADTEIDCNKITVDVDGKNVDIVMDYDYSCTLFPKYKLIKI